MEGRLLDRMEAAAGTAAQPVTSAMLVDLDFAVGQGFAVLLSEPAPDGDGSLRALLPG